MNEPVRISQEMIRLYDEYTHLTLDRRDFMNKLVRMTGSAAAAAAIVPLLEANQARAAIVAEDDARLTTEDVAYPGASGDMKGYLAKPADATGKLPAVIVIHENRGLNPHIEDIARRLALANFIAFAPDGLTSVGGYPGSDEKGAAAFRSVDGKKMTEDFIAAAKWLKARPDSSGKLGAVGFCFGGGMVNQLAVRLGADLNAGVAFYGRQAGVDDVPKISAPLMFNYAGNDQRVNEGIAAYEAALKANNKVYMSHMYDGKQHGFHNDTTPRYDEAAAKLAWERTLEWFNKYLR